MMRCVSVFLCSAAGGSNYSTTFPPPCSSLRSEAHLPLACARRYFYIPCDLCVGVGGELVAVAFLSKQGSSAERRRYALRRQERRRTCSAWLGHSCPSAHSSAGRRRYEFLLRRRGRRRYGLRRQEWRCTLRDANSATKGMLLQPTVCPAVCPVNSEDAPHGHGLALLFSSPHAQGIKRLSREVYSGR